MKTFATRVATILAAVLTLASCSQQKAGEKEKYIWVAVDANFERFSNKDSIAWYLDKVKDTGFNNVVVDVRGVEGDVRYKSAIFDEMKTWEGYTFEGDWDYLQYMIDEVHKRGMKVTVSATVFPLGSPCRREGPVYRNPELKKLTCVQYGPQGLSKIEDDPSQVAAFMNPLLPEAQELAMSCIRELFENYDFDGFCLDYCRFPGPQADFSDASREAFEQQLGQKVENWPEDIVIWSEDGEIVPGPYYKQWWKFRSQIIRDFIAKVKEYKDSVKPEVSLEYWAASWLHGLYRQGQNWAAPGAPYYREYCDSWASEDYGQTGFADQLDVFISGTYLERVRGLDDNESIEYGLARSRRDVEGKCKMVGSYAVYNGLDYEDATYVCMMESDGVMAFDICYFPTHPYLWDDIKRGIDRAEKELKIRK